MICTRQVAEVGTYQDIKVKHGQQYHVRYVEDKPSACTPHPRYEGIARGWATYVMAVNASMKSGMEPVRRELIDMSSTLHGTRDGLCVCGGGGGRLSGKDTRVSKCGDETRYVCGRRQVWNTRQACH
jgi:hypothetical protein